MYYNSFVYRSLSGSPLNGSQQDSRKEQSYIPMPAGYSVAPDSSEIAKNVIAKHLWGVWRMCTQSKCYGGGHYRNHGSAAGVKDSVQMWQKSGNNYRIKPGKPWYKLLIRRKCTGASKAFPRTPLPPPSVRPTLHLVPNLPSCPCPCLAV